MKFRLGNLVQCIADGDCFISKIVYIDDKALLVEISMEQLPYGTILEKHEKGEKVWVSKDNVMSLNRDNVIEMFYTRIKSMCIKFADTSDFKNEVLRRAVAQLNSGRISKLLEEKKYILDNIDVSKKIINPTIYYLNIERLHKNHSKYWKISTRDDRYNMYIFTSDSVDKIAKEMKRVLGSDNVAVIGDFHGSGIILQEALNNCNMSAGNYVNIRVRNC